MNMLAPSIYHQTRPYSKGELYSALIAYLEDKFVFRKLELNQWMGEECVLFKYRDEYKREVFNSGRSTEELWFDGEFEDWKTCTPITVKNICSEFLFKNGCSVAKNQKILIKDIVNAETSHGSLIETVKFNPILKPLIEEGRQIVRGVRPLFYGSNKRVRVELNEGDLCYFCWNAKNPYVVNPAYVFKKMERSYILIFFSNQHKGAETSKLEINMARFINAQANEVGLTPYQAVLQRFC